jgi:hypothetical protein
VASIRRVIHQTGRMSWQARWRDPTGSQRSKNFPRRIDAERFLVTVEAATSKAPTSTHMLVGSVSATSPSRRPLAG